MPESPTGRATPPEDDAKPKPALDAPRGQTTASNGALAASSSPIDMHKATAWNMTGATGTWTNTGTGITLTWSDATSTSPPSQDLGTGLRVLQKAESEFIIYGPGSVEIVDREGDRITGPALRKALPQLLMRARLSLQHLDVLVGAVIPEWGDYRTEVRPLSKADFDMFPWLSASGAKVGDEALMVVGSLYNDNSYSTEVRKQISEGALRSFSISGKANAESKKMDCSGFTCKVVKEITDIALSAVTICKVGMNQSSGFVILSKEFKLKGCACTCHV